MHIVKVASECFEKSLLDCRDCDLLAGFRAMLDCVGSVTVGNLGMLGSTFLVTGFVKLGGFLMMLGGLVMMLGGLLVMLLWCIGSLQNCVMRIQLSHVNLLGEI